MVVAVVVVAVVVVIVIISLNQPLPTPNHLPQRMDRITLRVMADAASFKKSIREGAASGFGVISGYFDDDDPYADDFVWENSAGRF